jgi:hypothetical protein
MCVVFGAAGIVCASAAQAQESLTTSGAAGQPISIREHAGWDRNCEGVPHPTMWLDEAPRHGTVCARTEAIKIQSMFYGTQAQCIGREVSGVRLIYLPRPGYVGPDSARYAVQYPSVRRTVSVAVTVTEGKGASLPGVVVPVTETRQPPGPVPKCDDGVS